MNPDRMIYFVLCDFGPKLGKAYVERDPADMDRATTIKDIQSGQFAEIVQILECNPAEHICSDVTEELLRECFNESDEPTMTSIERMADHWDHVRERRRILRSGIAEGRFLFVNVLGDVQPNSVREPSVLSR